MISIISNSIDSISRLSKIIQRYKEKDIPCISVELDIPEVHFIGTDNYAAMSAVVEHIVTIFAKRELWMYRMS